MLCEGGKALLFDVIGFEGSKRKNPILSLKRSLSLTNNQNSMNNRANILYFISHLVDSAARESHPAYIHMINRDIVRIIDAVAPQDGSGAANIRVARSVLSTLQQKSVLQPTTVSELCTVLDEREAGKHAFMTGEEGEGAGGGRRLGKREIEQRIEEDRERHKRMREEIWKVDSGVGVGVGGGMGVEGQVDGDEELRRMWEEGSEIGEDDYQIGREDLGERQQAIELG